MKRSILHHRIQQPLASLLYTELAAFAPVEAVAGVVLGGCHLASIVGLFAALQGEMSLNVIHVRPTAKDHGTKKLIEAPSHGPSHEVVLIEDVVTTGQSSANAAQQLRASGYEVRGVLALLDRRTKRADILPDGSKIRSIYTLNDFQDCL
jgi:orotate phosphoribosyltransferase